MKDRGMYGSCVYHLCAGSQLEECALLSSYKEYLAYYYMKLKKEGKGTRYLYTKFECSGRVYHHYLRVVDET